MAVIRIAFAVGFLLPLAFAIRWLANYSAESRNANSGPAWTLGFGGFIGRPSRDTTVSAYARSVTESSRENDAHAARLMETVTAKEFEESETTEARTEVPRGG